MIKILVVSDSHGNSEDIKTLVNETEFNYMFFFGWYAYGCGKFKTG